MHEVVIINEHKATSHTASCKLNLKKSEGRKRMYQVWSNFLNPGQIAMLGIVVTFLLTFLALKHPFSFLPSDHGREFAVNGGLSRGKLRFKRLCGRYARFRIVRTDKKAYKR